MIRRWMTGALAAVVLAGASCSVKLTPGGLYDLAKGVKDAKKELTAENEYYLGRAVATKILAGADYRYLEADGFASGTLGPLTSYVSAVGSVVAFAAMETPRSGDRPAPLAGWHFVVLDDDQVNAFAAPGGFIFVTAGAVRQARSEDELAAILAHEVAHQVRGHALGSIQKSRLSGVYKKFLDSSVELDPAVEGEMNAAFGGSIDDVVDGALVKGYSRDTEYEADRVAAAILASAGYDASALVRYLEVLGEHQDTGSGGFYATHPRADERIGKLRAVVAKLPARKVPTLRVSRFVDATASLR